MTRLGMWKTWFPVSERNYFGANIWLPARIIDGTVLYPGQRFEWWSRIGPISSSRGFGPGGFIAGERALIDNLKFAAPGFVYSVGMAPPLAAASLAALECMRAEPERVRTLQARAAQFLRLAREARIDVGSSSGVAIVPAIIGSSIGAARLSQALFRRGLNVQPILYPAVPENGARLRFFLSSLHTEEQVRNAVAVLAEEIEAL